MTKNEIYDQVVQLTTELAQTKVAEKIFNAATEGEAAKAQKIIDAFPLYYPELNQKIVDFGLKFNELIGDTEEDDEKRRRMFNSCGFIMEGLLETKFITQISQATDTKDTEKILKLIETFKKENSGLVENLVDLQEKFTKYRESCKTKLTGEIFGTEADEKNGVFIFDNSIIDALSFYVLIILGKISDVHLFCVEDGNLTSADRFFDAIQEATNEAFAEFVASYNIVDWVGKDEEYQTVGEILVAALADKFEEQVEEEPQE